MNEKNLEIILRVLIAVVLWVVLLALIAITALITSTFGIMIPALIYWLPVFLGIAITTIIGSEEGWMNIKQNVVGKLLKKIDVGIREGLRDLSDEELKEGLEKIGEAKARFGLDTEKRKKQKRDGIDQRLDNLSDSDLKQIKAQLEDGTLADDEVIDLLDRIERQQQQG